MVVRNYSYMISKYFEANHQLESTKITVLPLSVDGKESLNEYLYHVMLSEKTPITKTSFNINKLSFVTF